MSYEPKRFDFSIPVRVNLSSDTQTKPSRGMKAAMIEAEVGDEQMGSDPTVWALCDRTAALLGKDGWAEALAGALVMPREERVERLLPRGGVQRRARSEDAVEVEDARTHRSV